MSELVIVAGERQVEIVARDGVRAETRRRLGERLAAGLLQNTRFANAATVRAALAAVVPKALENDAAVARLSANPVAWERLVDAIDDAVAVLRAAGVDARALGAIEDEEPSARLLRRAMNALDARLERAGLVDERLRWERLGSAISRAPALEIVRIVSATHVRARFVHAWSSADAAWWKPMALALERASGGARVELPIVSKAIDASRASDPFEVLVADVARLLDDAPLEVDVETPFGDLSFTSAVPRGAIERVVIRHALDAEAQARAVARLVSDALAEGIATDRVAIGLPHGVSDAAKRALARYFEDMDVPLHLADDASCALLDVAFELLEVGAEGLPRQRVAEVLRSRVLDAEALSGVAGRAGRVALRDLASALERNPTADGDDAVERLVATASAGVGDEVRRANRGVLARRVGSAFGTVGRATRAAHAKRARALFAQVGLAARAGGAVRAALARDEGVRNTLIGAERDAYARDARALESLTAAIGEVERAGIALGGDETCTAETFAHELARAMRARGAPGAARAGAVRAVSLAELAGEPLELLIVIDANDGVLPARHSSAGLASPALEDALGRKDIRRAAPDAAARSLVELAVAAQSAHHIALVHRAADDDGAALAPSPLVSWLERSGVTAELVHSAPLLGIPTTAHERELALVAVAPERAAELAPHAARVAARERTRETIHATGDTTTARLEMTEPLRAIFEIETGGGARPLSVTAVERLARCPFQGFAAQLLGAIDDDMRADDTPDRREEGILAHEALSAAFTAAAPLWSARPRDRAAIESIALQASDDILSRSGGALVRAALDRIHSEVTRIVALAIEDEAWDFAFAERAFGNADREGEWPPLAIEREGARLTLRGRIDRVDVAHDNSAVRAIDYKRRVSLPAIADLGVTAVQIPLYAIVAKRALGVPDARGRYLSTVSPARTATLAFDERFAALVREEPDGTTEATTFAIDHVRALRSGDIGPKPSAPKWCAQCGLDAACRRPRFAVTMVPREETE